MAKDDDNLAESTSSALESADQLATEIGSAGVFDDSNVHNPIEALHLKRQKIEGEHQGLRGVFNYFLGLAHVEPTFQAEMKTIADAESKYNTGEVQSNERLQAQQEQAKLQQWRAELDSGAADEQKTDDQRKQDSIERSYKSEVQAADDVASDRTYWSQGDKSRQEARPYSHGITHDAETIHKSERKELDHGDAASARQAKHHEAQLGGEGRNDDARVEQELQRTSQLSNSQASALAASQAAGSNLNVAHGGDASNLQDAVRKLDAATTKLDKVLANTKTLVLLKD